MQNKIEAYIDSFEYITILIDKSNYNDEKAFYIGKDKKESLEILDCYEEENHFKYVIKNKESIKLNKDYEIYDESNNKCKLKIGSIVRTKEFDEAFKYDGPLGFEYTPKKTTFRVWSPVAKEIYLELYYVDETKKIFLKYIDNGMWETTVSGNLDGVGYIYFVRVFDYFRRVNDPYAIAGSANACCDYVINPKKIYKMKYEKPYFSGNYTDAIIYEASIRDFTSSRKDDKKGTYLGMIDEESDYLFGLDYINSLGISHLQLLPTYDFGGVNDYNKQVGYNWGYNPVRYFVPSGWYSINPDDPYSRINELKELIDISHKKGLRIVMDVVFNHVYKVETFPFDVFVPGYYFRMEADGKLSNATGCGNVIATERNMARRFIIDVLKYYAINYNVSGFRFDLMGLIDVDTLNMASKELKEIDKNIILYGEGWNMLNPLPDHKRAHMYNHKEIPSYAFFNDRYRDLVRGNQWNRTYGYALGYERSIYDLGNLLKGSCLNFFKFDKPSKSINYVECHDNYTFYDYCRYFVGLDDTKSKDASRLALSLILISNGVPFIHAGEEFFRTKMGVENSYNSQDRINKFDYKRLNRYISNVNAIKDLINIRKKYDVFRLTNKHDIEARVHTLDEVTSANTFGLYLQGKNYNLFIFIKNDYNSSVIDEVEDYNLIFDGKKSCNKNQEEYIFNLPGVYIFERK